MRSDNLLGAESHFEFGKNWSDYAQKIDDEAISAAEEGVLSLLPKTAIEGARWLDIGSGSGLHSLAAARLGASDITAIDIDADSVATTQRVLADHGVTARVMRKSVFEIEDLGTYDVVYSWGVLHHTGDMWRAIDCASRRVAPGGWFALALYQKTPLCGAWTVEKAIYTKAGEPVRRLMRKAYILAYRLGLAVQRRSFSQHVESYSQKRGMSFEHDVHDWLGGYPYESVTPEAARAFMVERDFQPVLIGDLKPGLGIFGTGCAEFVFRRNGAPDSR